MVVFFKKYNAYLLLFFIIGLLVYDYHFRTEYKKFYVVEGLYTIGKIKEIQSYGRGTGYNFLYTFQIGGKTYVSEVDIDPLHFYEANTFKEKNFLIVYLKSNPHINRLYITVPIVKKMNSKELKRWVDSKLSVKQNLKRFLLQAGSGTIIFKKSMHKFSAAFLVPPKLL